MNKVLVTGSNGQLGSCIQQLVREGSYDTFEFIFTDSKTLDITDENVVEDFFFSNALDYVINCAAYTAVDKAEEAEEEAFLVNADGVKNLANACREQQAVLIHISTDYVFDGTKEGAYFPEDPTNPINIYGKSKLLGEQYAQRYNPKTIIIRTSWVYSEYGSNFVKTMRKLFQEKEELNIVADQYGRPTNALKLAEYILEDVLNEEDEEFNIRHYSSDAKMSWFQFAEKIKKDMGSEILLHPISTEEFPTKAERPKNSVLE